MFGFNSIGWAGIFFFLKVGGLGKTLYPVYYSVSNPDLGTFYIGSICRSGILSSA